MGTSHREEDTLSILYEASRRGSLSTLNSILQKEPLILHKISQSGFTETPLHMSALLGHLEFTKALLTYKPKLAIEVDSSKNTPLHLASAEGHIDIVKELLKVNNKPCLFPNEEGKIPLHYAVIRGRIEVVKELVKAKPESLSFLDDGNTVFHLCVIHNRLETLKGLVELELAISGKLLYFTSSDGVGNTVLHLAVTSRQVEV
ncbi:ankyrin repeat-containing protein BDA1-like [Neltuma alba]|uniref:ankyrin repeat-containing protein BDA1-like n=1 Tax=Neltuma alba TaxID=207710 RepID=UPI0010A414B9|nr:ankyrin repeat-containing protein BDA1-like [Prosopis alba]